MLLAFMTLISLPKENATFERRARRARREILELPALRPPRSLRSV